MKMRKKSGGGANWMDTYGDMVTLLLCFFVLLYSMSTISEEKWKMLVASFNPNAMLTMTENSGNDGPNADPNELDGSGMGLSQVDKDMDDLYEILLTYITDKNLEESMSVERDDDGKIFVTFNQSIFFDGEQSTLKAEGKQVLEEFADMISTAKLSIKEIRVMGHTAQADPGRPNNPQRDRQLSAERAANALAYIQMNCDVHPALMVSEGYGQWHPVATNDTSEGRAKNRRVEIVISGIDLETEGEYIDWLQKYYTSEMTPDGSTDITDTGSDDSGTTNEEGEGVPTGGEDTAGE